MITRHSSSFFLLWGVLESLRLPKHLVQEIQNPMKDWNGPGLLARKKLKGLWIVGLGQRARLDTGSVDITAGTEGVGLDAGTHLPLFRNFPVLRHCKSP